MWYNANPKPRCGNPRLTKQSQDKKEEKKDEEEIARLTLFCGAPEIQVFQLGAIQKGLAVLASQKSTLAPG
jgi:hypothetical protein